VIFRTRVGVSSRASKPSGSRRGKKRPAAFPAIPFEFLEFQRPVDGGHRTFDRLQGGLGPARRTPRPADVVVDDRGHVTLLDLATELATKFVGAKFDDRVMRHPLDGAIESIEVDRDLGRFDEEPRKFFLKFDGVPLHGQPPIESIL
jgi:hypothetical protein